LKENPEGILPPTPLLLPRGNTATDPSAIDLSVVEVATERLRLNDLWKVNPVGATPLVLPARTTATDLSCDIPLPDALEA